MLTVAAAKAEARCEPRLAKASRYLGEPLLPLQIDWYVTVLDLGSWGAVYTEGWNRHVVLKGMEAKRVKQTINCQRIYPRARVTGERFSKQQLRLSKPRRQ